MKTIDGSEGEGGGQILRTSLALSILTGEPVRIENIRARRKKPGLLRQHLTALLAAAEICDGDTEGAELRAKRIALHPKAVRPGRYRFDIGTAGSASLVLQTVLPPLMTAEGPSDLVIAGGTHNPKAPPFEFLRDAFLPLLARIGPRVDVQMTKPGFYPAGGGELLVQIHPEPLSSRLEITTASAPRLSARAVVARLPRHIAERELAVLEKRLELADAEVVEESRSEGPGNAVTVTIERTELVEVVTGFGQKGVSAERVAANVAREVKAYLRSGAPVGEHLADQLLLPMALGRGGRFKTGPASLHTTTNAAVIQRFLPARIEIGDGEVRVET